MSLTYGFYNSLYGDRKYDATQLSTIFDGIIKDGVFATIGSAMTVTAESGLTINVGTGRAWFNHTWTLNDTILPIVAEESELLLDRIDAVVLEVNFSEDVRANSIKIVKGTPASSPVNPQMIDNDLVHQHPLCYIYRKANSTEITQANITNVVGTSECPFVTGILSVVTTDALIVQWQAQFDQWMAGEQSDYDEWFNAIKEQLSGDVAANLANQISEHIANKNNPHNITPAQIGAAPTSHGTHLPSLQTAEKATFLRNDGTWQKVTPSNIGAAASSHGTHVTYGSATPKANGSASVGSASTVSRSDHVHPTDTSRAPAYSYGTEDLTPGSSALTTGKLHFVYE